MTVWQLLWSLSGAPVLLCGLFYAVFSRLWFTYIAWPDKYHGAFSEKFLKPKAKIRSAVIRFLAGCVMGVMVGLMAKVLQLSSFEAFLKLGLFVSVGFVAVSMVQYAGGTKQRRVEILLETSFQLIAIECISLLWAVWELRPFQ